jgi:hypothetical protein
MITVKDDEDEYLGAMVWSEHVFSHQTLLLPSNLELLALALSLLAKVVIGAEGVVAEGSDERACLVKNEGRDSLLFLGLERSRSEG